MNEAIANWDMLAGATLKTLFRIGTNDQIRAFFGPIPEDELQGYREMVISKEKP